MKIAALVATVFGVGYVPVAPGTAGSLVAALLAYPIARTWGMTVLAPLGLLVGVFGIWFAGAYAKSIGQTDPKSCVVDEVAGQWIALACAPFSPLGFLVAFTMFRFFDIRKIWPADVAERLPGGLGIVADDIVAGIMAAMSVWLFVHGGYLK